MRSSPPRRVAGYPLPLKWAGFPAARGWDGLAQVPPAFPSCGARTTPTRLQAHLQVCVLSPGSKTKFSGERGGWPKVKLTRLGWRSHIWEGRTRSWGRLVS